MTRLTIILDVPGRVLSPNGRAHWRAVHKARKSQRLEAKLVTMAAMRREKIKGPWPAATAQATFVFTANRRRDSDNAAAMLKGTGDGIADAGLVENDSVLTWLPPILVNDPNGQAYCKIVLTETKG